MDLLNNCHSATIVDPIVSTTHGQVRGKLRNTAYDDQFYCFDGIPFAKPPLGKLRFRSPEPIEPWTGVRDCTEVAAMCIQFSHWTKSVEGSEDCLYLNIYAKKLKSDKPLPVMVYIYGGGYNTGSPSRLECGPDYFMMKDVIFVTIGYRLGVFGFLNFPEQVRNVSGNAGLKDIVMALKWLKQNYLNFNGDPENVTLFGHSSGSEAVAILSMVPQCEGLFHKAIFLSGVPITRSGVPNLINRFAKDLGYEGPEDNEQILNFYLSVEGEKLCTFKFWTQEEKDQGNGPFPFGPTVESPNVPDAIITKNILDMMSNKAIWSRNIPIILSSCSFESLYTHRRFASQHSFDIFKDHPDYWHTLDVRYRCDLDTQIELIKKIIKLHVGDKEFIPENIFDFLHMHSYGSMYHPIHRYLAPRLMHAKAPTYLYRFDYDSPDFNLFRFRMAGREVRGCCHCSEMSFLFYVPQSFKLEKDSEDFKKISVIMDIFTAFASTSDPNNDSLNSVVWEPISANGTRKCLNVSNEITFIDWPEYEKCLKWDQYFREAGLRLY